jgi:transposase InsO family protein
MCRVLGVSASGYHAWRTRRVSQRQRADTELGGSIERIFDKHKGTYGSPRVRMVLSNEGRPVSRKRVARLMRQRGLRASAPRRWVRTTDSNHALPIAKNLLERDFSASAPNQKWASDITYIATHDGWLYLATVIDLFSRRIVGWSMSTHIDEALVHAAITMALHKRDKPDAHADSLIFHSDRGSQYAARGIAQLCAAHHIQQSMSRRGNCWDNAPSESFFATLKRECVKELIFTSRAEARTAIFEYIEIYYNRERLHSTLGYRTPVDFENAHRSINLCPL